MHHPPPSPNRPRPAARLPNWGSPNGSDPEALMVVVIVVVVVAAVSATPLLGATATGGGPALATQKNGQTNVGCKPCVAEGKEVGRPVSPPLFGVPSRGLGGGGPATSAAVAVGSQVHPPGGAQAFLPSSSPSSSSASSSPSSSSSLVSLFIQFVL